MVINKPTKQCFKRLEQENVVTIYNPPLDRKSGLVGCELDSRSKGLQGHNTLLL